MEIEIKLQYLEKNTKSQKLINTYNDDESSLKRK